MKKYVKTCVKVALAAALFVLSPGCKQGPLSISRQTATGESLSKAKSYPLSDSALAYKTSLSKIDFDILLFLEMHEQGSADALLSIFPKLVEKGVRAFFFEAFPEGYTKLINSYINGTAFPEEIEYIEGLRFGMLLKAIREYNISHTDKIMVFCIKQVTSKYFMRTELKRYLLISDKKYAAKVLAKFEGLNTKAVVVIGRAHSQMGSYLENGGLNVVLLFSLVVADETKNPVDLTGSGLKRLLHIEEILKSAYGLEDGMYLLCQNNEGQTGQDNEGQTDEGLKLIYKLEGTSKN